ncbi:MAG: GIY-YIG nuclease family protein [Candidatus Limnocylindrales bacterium]
MNSRDRRRELRARFDQRRPQAGVYALRNTVSGRVLVASATDLDAVRARIEFARATQTPSALDLRLMADVREFGLDAFVFEVLDRLDAGPEASPEDLRADLLALEQLWREKLAGTSPH